MKFALAAILGAVALASPSIARQSSEAKPAPAAQAAAPANPLAQVPAARPDDVKSIDSTLHALYEVISGPAGERDWNRFRSLFAPEGRLTSAQKNPDGTPRVRLLSVEDYVRGAGSYFTTHGFFESSVGNRIERFGNMAQVFSAYESRHAAGEAPFARGINSIQLLTDGTRWYIVSILWDEERPDNPLPKDFSSK
jgi:hypothetical protein